MRRARARAASRVALVALAAALAAPGAAAARPTFRVLAFYTAKEDAAHISFVEEANRWFPKVAAENGFSYEATDDWRRLNARTLARYRVVVFLDTRPEGSAERAAFERYMKAGGAWMGFHFAAFALTPSKYPQNWDWYHVDFLGAGEYRSNTWRPTSAVLRVEDRTHPATAHLPATFASQPNEWYRWRADLRARRDIKVLLSIDPASFPLGTGPKPEEIWHDGDYPVVWTNTRYRMIYVNMGHDDVDYAHGNRRLSSQFGGEVQNRLLVDALLWLGGLHRRGTGRTHSRTTASPAVRS